MTIFEAPDGTFFVRTGEGRIWFDTVEEAMDAVGDDARVGPGAIDIRLDPHTDEDDDF